MNKKIQIDGQWFDEKISGMTLVDAYYIPDEMVEQYRIDREMYKEKAIRFFSQKSDDVTVDFTGSQDGEAVVSRDKEGEIIDIVGLDPDSIWAMKAADLKGELEAYLTEQSDE